MGVNEKEKSLKKQIQNDDTADTNGTADTKFHCQCGTGCPDCYGKVNCGCPDCCPEFCPECYTPEKKPRKKKLKIRKAEMVELSFDSVIPIAQLIYENSILSHHIGEVRAKVNRIVIKTDEEVDVVKRSSYSNYHFKRRPVSCIDKSQTKSSHRMSLPDINFDLKLEKPKKREKLREPFIVKEVGPPKQTKYFCKKCKADVCNACFSTVCSAHDVQFIGSAKFHCQSPFHKIKHDPSMTLLIE